jgi:formylglycine-generating enzyme required for sulfatase activity
MSDIFVCYSRKDSAIANRVRQHLEAEGWSVFLDVRTRIGQRYDQVIERELEAARAVVVLWSTAARESHDVKDEAKTGRDRGILFPALIERVKPPLGFGHLQTADLVGWAGDGEHAQWQQLVDSLRVHLDAGSDGKPATPAAMSLGPAAPAAVTPKPRTFRDRLKVGGDGPLMAVIPAGRFVMGSPPDEPERSDDEGPQHEVRIAQPFALGVCAVTFDEYDLFCRDTGSPPPDDEGWGRGNRPVINVSWDDAQAYCAWLGEQTTKRYRLPSEAEREYACRAGTTTPFYVGARITTDQANFNGKFTYNGSPRGQFRGKTIPVGSFPANAFGLHDMHGNVLEWCQDNWHPNYDGAPGDGSVWEGRSEGSRVLRGGSWLGSPRHARAANRDVNHTDYRDVNLGFRLCRGSPIE